MGRGGADDGTHFYAEERPKYYDTHIGKRRTGQLHRVRVGGLRPGTTYRYRIMQQAVLRDEGNKRVILGEGYGSDILKHEPYRATTLDPSRERIECWVVNDIHGRDSILRQLLADAPERRPDFVCFNGDMLTQDRIRVGAIRRIPRHGRGAALAGRHPDLRHARQP